MKRKTFIMSIILLVIFSALILTSCTIFSVNKDRIENETAFTVSYKGQTQKISKKELDLYIKNEINKQLYSNVRYLYILQRFPQYAETYKLQIIESIKKNIIETVVKEKIQIMIAKEKFSMNNTNKESFDILEDWEKQYVIDSLNDEIINQYLKIASNAYSAYILKIQSKENKKNNNDDENIIEQIPDLEPRKFEKKSNNDSLIKRIPKENYTSDIKDWKTIYWTTKYGNYGLTDQNKILNNSLKLINYVVSNSSKNDNYLEFSKNVSEYLELNKKENLTKEEKAKLSELVSVFKDAYIDTLKIFKEKSYESLLKEISDKELVAKYNDELTNERLKNTYEDELNAAYSKIITDASSKWKSSDANSSLKSLIEKGDNLSAHPVYKYLDENRDKKITSAFGVQSIRFDFTKEQKDALKIIKEKYGKNSDIYYKARKYIALEDESIDDNIKNIVKEQKIDLGIKIYISNLNYNSALKTSKENSPYELDPNSTDDKLIYKAYSFKEILKLISEDLKKSAEKVEEEYKNSPKEFKDRKNTSLIVERLKVFEMWINKVNDNPKMFSNDGKYPISFVTMKGTYKNSDTTKLSEETIALARNIFYSNINKDYTASSMSGEIKNVKYENNDKMIEMFKDSISEISYVIDDNGINIATISNYGSILENNDYKYFSKEGKEVSKDDADVLYAVLKKETKTNGKNSKTYGETLKDNYINSLVQEFVDDQIKAAYKKAKVDKNKKVIESAIKEAIPDKKKK